MIGAIFTIATIAYGLSAPLVGWVSERVPITRVIAGGAVAMALSLPLLSLAPGIVLTGAALCLVSVAMPSRSIRPRRNSATRSIGADCPATPPFTPSTTSPTR